MNAMMEVLAFFPGLSLTHPSNHLQKSIARYNFMNHKLWFRYFLLLVTSAMVIPVRLYAQFPGRTQESKLSEEGNVTVTHLTVLNKEGVADNLVSLAYSVLHRDEWASKVEISSIEKMNSTGVPFALRDHHTWVSQSIEKKIRTDHQHMSEISVQLASVLMWNKYSGEIATQTQSLTTCISFSNKSILEFGFGYRYDKMHDPLEIKSIIIPEGSNSFNTAFFHFKGSSEKKAGLFTEGTVGKHYHLSRYSLRIGERLRLTSRVELQGDVEISRISGNETTVTGYLVRGKVDWHPIKTVEINMVVLGNSFLGLSAVMGAVTWTHKHHQFKAEYRELRDASLQYLETSHPLFSSRILLQYRYFIKSEK